MSEPVSVLGRHPVWEALEREPEMLEKVLLQRGLRALYAFRRRAAAAGIPVQDVPATRLNRIAQGVPHQGVAAIRAAVGYADLEYMLGTIAPTLDEVRQKKPKLLVLDGIQDPRNYGATIRSAVAAGVQGLIVSANHMAPVSAATVKASAGTVSRIPIARAGNLPEVLYQLKERGYYVAGTVMQEGRSVWSVDWDRPMAVVLGSEGRGLRPRVAAECDFMVTIPMRGDAESLNVSVAAAVVLFAATRP